jgi:hypothetical protein
MKGKPIVKRRNTSGMMYEARTTLARYKPGDVVSSTELAQRMGAYKPETSQETDT